MELKDNSVNKEIEALPKDIQEKSMPCTSNFEDHSFYNVEDNTDDHCGGAGGGDDASSNKNVEDEVDILECYDETEVSECSDGTDMYSSSFSGTVSEHENESALNDQEADSMVYTDNSLPFMVKKKKLTDHWRRFIHPVMWRCKWIELKIKEFRNQALIYDKELEESCQAKQLELENIKSEEVGIKALPALACHSKQTQIRKRQKRKRVEETSDVASYTLNHNLFSYYEHRKSRADIALNDNSRNIDKKNKSSKEDTVFSEEIPLLEFREGDTYLEQILLKIESTKLEVCNLKNRVDKVLHENPSRFSSVKTLNLLGSSNVLTSSEQEKLQLVIKSEDEKPEKPVKYASVSSDNEIPPEDDETTDILLSEILASTRREGKAIVPNKKTLQKTEQTSVNEEGSSRTVRKRTPRNREMMMMNEETKPKRHRVSREKPKSNVMVNSRFKLPNRKRKRGKRRSGSSGLRRT